MSTRAQEHKTIRCFIALTIPVDIQKRLADIQSILKQNDAQARWVKTENIHITLRFLGDRDPQQIREIIKALSQIFIQKPNLRIKIDSLNAFPDVQHPKILWAGISEGADETVRIYDAINDSLEKLGIPKDQECALPHLTLARCKTEQERRTCADAIKKAPTFSVEAHPQSVTFYQSTLSSQGSIYVPITSIIFQ